MQAYIGQQERLIASLTGSSDELFFGCKEQKAMINLAKNDFNSKRFRFVISLSRNGVFPGSSVAQHHRGHGLFHFPVRYL
jgi:hypothetical protein